MPQDTRTWRMILEVMAPIATKAFMITHMLDRVGQNAAMATYTVNKRAVAHARELIDASQYVLNSDWGEAQPRADDENEYLKTHSWEEYAEWFLGLTEGANDETKARYAFVYGNFRRIHRTGLIACVYRASEWRHKDVELAAHKLLQELDKKSGLIK
jgi:hypothetical protein